MSFRDIEYFAVLAEHGHVGRAAEALGLSQPALSMSLRRLERSMNTKLCRRTPKGIELTDVGRALLAQVRRLRQAHEDVMREVEDLSQGRAGNLRVGAHAGVMDNLMGPACCALLNAAPGVMLTVTIESNESVVSAIRDGRLDLGVSILPSPPHPDMVQEPLLKDTIVVFASAQHRLAKRRQVTLDDLENERWAATAFSAPALPLLSLALQDRGRHPLRYVAQTNSLPFRDQLVAHTDLLGTSSKRMLRNIQARHRVVELPVKDFSVKRSVGVFHRKDAYLSPAARQFIGILKSTARDIARKS
ncbi:MAG: LysR family transcriptional regulator [Burkholderiales bacterium]|nr:LysR family transcriptional regulator [Burkholderiales bacterium]